MILVNKYLQTIIVPILQQWVAVSIGQDVIDEFTQNIEFAFGPDNLIPPLKVLTGVLGPQPAMTQDLPFRTLPNGFDWLGSNSNNWNSYWSWSFNGLHTSA